MKTKVDVAGSYDLDKHGRVKNPGRFEGEHYSTVLAYDMVMDGAQDDTLYWPDDTCVDVIALDDELRKLWGLDQGDAFMLIEQTDQGFVTGRAVDQVELDRITRECEEACEKEDDSD
jgi:hypothetical protein